MTKRTPRYIPAKAALSHELAELIRWVRFTNEFRSIERLIWFKGVKGRERNGEHTYQLILVAWYLVSRRAKHLDLFLVLMYIIVHDLVETYAADTPAFAGKAGRYAKVISRKDKKQREEKALQRIDREWGGIVPDIVEKIKAYERQEDDESRFVYALDKLVAELNIFEDNGRTDKMLGLTLEEKIAYKHPRIAKDPLLLKYYDEFCEFLAYRPDLYYRPTPCKVEKTAS
jgi:putative hydrolase of HD superfamily